MTSRSSALGLPPTSEDVKPHGDALLATAAEQLRRMREERDSYRLALQDLVAGAELMLEGPLGKGRDTLSRYAREVQRVALAALACATHSAPPRPTA